MNLSTLCYRLQTEMLREVGVDIGGVERNWRVAEVDAE
jgi:hypothetical protein